MERIKKIRKHHAVFILAAGVVAFALLNSGGFDQLAGLISGSIFNSQPLFSSLDDFVLFGFEGIVLEEGTQVSSGDIGSNKNLDLQKDVIVNGNLFADKIELGKNTSINGNVSFNKLQIKKEAEIFGSTTTPVSLPIAELPSIPDFPTGTQDITFTGISTANILTAGNYRDITLEKDSRLVLTGGVYNLEKLFLKENSVVILATTTVLNIKSELKAQQKVSILPSQNTKFDDLKINFKSQKPVEFGKRSFLNFKLFAPNAQVHIGEETTMRGQILARKIKVEKEGILSKEWVFAKGGDLAKVFEDIDGSSYTINEIILDFSDGANFVDVKFVAEMVDGRITGFVESTNAYKIEVVANSPSELESIIQKINQYNLLLIEGIFRNYILGISF